MGPGTLETKRRRSVNFNASCRLKSGQAESNATCTPLNSESVQLNGTCQIADERTSKTERDLQQATNEMERLTLERDFYFKKASALEQENRELTESATKYFVHAQKLEWELTEVAIKYSQRAQNLDRTVSYLEITETVTLISDTPRILTFVPDTRRMKSSPP